MKDHMARKSPMGWQGVFILTIMSWIIPVRCVNVTYDGRSLLIDGQRQFLQSASIHYPRSTPQMWPQLVNLAKQGGIDVIQTYVFWDMHEPQRQTYNFEGRYDLVQFVKVVAAAGLYVNLRIGPYVCAEWNFGGFPSWLRFIPHMQFRTENDPFKEEMQQFVTMIVNLMKSEQLFAPQGGPIIMAQIENEYGNIDSVYGNDAELYIKWAANMAENLNIGVPWIMCQQEDAPGDIINTCNGFYCDSFTPNSPNKPKMWTENWAGWFHNWGRQLPRRPVEDIAFAVARFFAKGGSFQNYYMYHGGTNFERTAGEWITTSYDYDAPLDEYGQPRQPKWGHLRDLHAAIKLCEPALAVVDGDAFQTSLGRKQEAHIYANGQGSTVAEIVNSSTICAAFLSNMDTSSSDAKVQFNGQFFYLPPWSVSILPDCKTVTFNTATVGSQTTLMKMVPSESQTSQSKAWSGYLDLVWEQDLVWETYQERVGAWGSTFSSSDGLLEQINVTKDLSDYLWYMTSVHVSDPTTGNILVSGVKDSLHLFINGDYVGSPSLSFQANYSQAIQLEQGNNTIMVLSATLGLQNYGALLERENAGIGEVKLSLSTGNTILTNQQWTYQVGVQGEQLNLFTEAGAANVTWQSGPPPTNQALVWYKTTIDAPAGDSPVALDLASMGKGQAWINGQSVGRFWTIKESNLENFPGGTCSTACDYRGTYDPTKCTTGCGDPSQRWYHVPRDWLQPTKNFLVIFEEAGGDPSMVTLVTQVPNKVCSQISELHPLPWANSSSSKRQTPKLQLDCSAGHHISEVSFGSFGNPSGTCGSFQQGSCHVPLSTSFVNQECIQKQQCSFDVSWTRFAAEDPCPDQLKSLAIEALCTID